MKILFITDDFLPHIGGSRVYYYNLCTHLRACTVVVLTKKGPGDKEFDATQPFKIHRIFLWALPCKWTKIYELPTYASLFVHGLYLALRERVDIIHCGEALPTGLVGLLLSKILRKPYLVYTHAEDVTIAARCRFEGRALRFVLRCADAVIACSSFVQETMERMGVGAHKIVKVVPGVDDEFLRKDSFDAGGLRRKLALEGAKVILTVARLVKRKGIDMVILALPEVVERVPNLVYLIVGEGPEETALRELVKGRGLDTHVRFCGRVSGDELPLYYSLCDVFVQPNRELQDGDTEGSGIVFLEASAFGKPVIGGKAGGTQDSIVEGVTGLRVDGEDVGEIAHAIITVLKDEALAKRMGTSGRERIRREFRWQEKADEICVLSERLVGSSRK
jgi:phosphatidylinositol alpha-1,6-mannosyltransferase